MGKRRRMEHRNSTVLTSSNSLRTSRLDLLDTIPHEFFHWWNIERIRPQSLEPFNLDEVNCPASCGSGKDSPITTARWS